jgi:hypothetical protein
MWLSAGLCRAICVFPVKSKMKSGMNIRLYLRYDKISEMNSGLFFWKNAVINNLVISNCSDFMCDLFIENDVM